MTTFESDVRLIPRFPTAFVTAAYLMPPLLSGFFFFWSADAAETSVRLKLNIRMESLKIGDRPVHDARFFERGETERKWENTEDKVPNM